MSTGGLTAAAGLVVHEPGAPSAPTRRPLHQIAGRARKLHQRDQHLATVWTRFDLTDGFGNRWSGVFGARSGRETTREENRDIVLAVRLDIVGELHEEFCDNFLLMVLLRDCCFSAIRSCGDLGRKQ